MSEHLEEVCASLSLDDDIVDFALLEAGDAGAEAMLLKSLRAGGAAVVRLPESIEVLWTSIEAAFDGPCRELTREQGFEYGRRVHGAREFLETRVDLQDGSLLPKDAFGGDAVRLTYHRLEHVAKVTLAACCRAMGEPPETLLSLLDKTNGVSSSVIRLCKYPASSTESSTEKRVAFGAHTDTTFVTVAPCSPTPGLELLQEGAWTTPERGRDSSRDLLVFAGEFLQVISKSEFIAAVHRVATSPETRFSAPFLVRARKEATLQTGSESKMMELEGLTMGKFHRFLELRRRRIVSEHHKNNADQYMDPDDDKNGFILA